MKKQIKKGDKVLIIAGKHKGSVYTVFSVKPKKRIIFLSELMRELFKKNRFGSEKKKVVRFFPVDVSNVTLDLTDKI